MAEDNDAILEAAKKLPFSERTTHKAWFVRAAAYEDIAAGCRKALDPNAAIYSEVGATYRLTLHSQIWSTASVERSYILSAWCSLLLLLSHLSSSNPHFLAEKADMLLSQFKYKYVYRSCS